MSRIYLQECINHASCLKLGEGYLAVAHFRSYVAYGKLGRDEKVADHLGQALSARNIVEARTGT